LGERMGHFVGAAFDLHVEISSKIFYLGYYIKVDCQWKTHT
jgi:hypothetical protein